MAKQLRATHQSANFWLYAAWLIALGATLASLALQYVAGLIPCELCWFQRVFMYPLAILLGIAVARSDDGAARYGLALSIPGGVIAGYHYSLQMLGVSASTCSAFVACTNRYIEYFGFMTIPFGSLLSFIGITVALLLVMKRSRLRRHSQPPAEQ